MGFGWGNWGFRWMMKVLVISKGFRGILFDMGFSCMVF